MPRRGREVVSISILQTPQDRFLGFGTIDQVRDKLAQLEAGLRSDITSAHSPDYVTAAAPDWSYPVSVDDGGFADSSSE